MNRIISFMMLDFRSLTVKDKSVMLFIFIVNMIFFFGTGVVKCIIHNRFGNVFYR